MVHDIIVGGGSPWNVTHLSLCKDLFGHLLVKSLVTLCQLVSFVRYSPLKTMQKFLSYSSTLTISFYPGSSFIKTTFYPVHVSFCPLPGRQETPFFMCFTDDGWQSRLGRLTIRS